MRKPVALILAFVLALTLSVPAFAAEPSLSNFTKIKEYEEGHFTDVATGAWYAESVKTGYELGLISGSSDTTFSPTGNITIAEAIALASRLHSIYNTGFAEFEQGSPWYQVYIDYALRNHIIYEATFSNYNVYATRAQFAHILASTDLPLEGINSIPKNTIPDMAEDELYGYDVYKLYRAGILTGSDSYGTFKPNSYIQRSEVAAIISRMADSNLRKTFVLEANTYVPLEIEEVYVSTDILGTVCLSIVVKNIGDSAVDAFEFYSLVYDAFGDPVYYYDYGTNEFTGTWSVARDKALGAGQSLSKETKWAYYGFDNMKTVSIAITKVHTVDGKTYRLLESEYNWKSFSW